MNHRIRLTPRRLLVALVAAGGLSASPDASAFRCGAKLVTDGMHISKVLAICGQPVHEQRRTVLRRQVFIDRSTRLRHSGTVRRHVYAYDTPAYVEVEIRELTWNLGPNKFMRRVRFEDGIVTDVETLERGYRE